MIEAIGRAEDACDMNSDRVYLGFVGVINLRVDATAVMMLLSEYPVPDTSIFAPRSYLCKAAGTVV